MTVLYADPSALIRAYLADEPDHAELRAMLLEGADHVISSEIARVEQASAARAAARAGRIEAVGDLLDRFDLHTRSEARITLLVLRPEAILGRAYDLVTAHKLRALDAIHLAVALEDGRTVAAGDELVFVTRDEDQAAAARELGLAVQ